MKRGGKIPPLLFFISPVAEAMAAIRPGMPAGRAVVHRTTTAIRPTVPTRSTTASHRNGSGVASCRLIERRHRHGLGSRHRHKADADREQRCSKYLHWHSFPSLRGEITRDQMKLRHVINDDDGDASGGGASDDDASGDDANGGGASDGDASAPAWASSDRLRSATRPPAQRSPRPARLPTGPRSAVPVQLVR
jgi:hypothetical protein